MNVRGEYKKYVKAFNGFQVNVIKSSANLSSIQLAAELEIGYVGLMKIQNKDLWLPILLEPKTYENYCKLINRYHLVFPDAQTAMLNSSEINVNNEQVILNSFQYKAATQLLYKRRPRLNALA